jgi:histidyl-tRNA synthetase
MKAAARVGARAVVLLGEDELAKGQASVRDMAARDQIRVPLDAVVPTVARIAATAGTDPSDTDDQGAVP